MVLVASGGSQEGSTADDGSGVGAGGWSTSSVFCSGTRRPAPAEPPAQGTNKETNRGTRAAAGGSPTAQQCSVAAHEGVVDSGLNKVAYWWLHLAETEGKQRKARWLGQGFRFPSGRR